MTTKYVPRPATLSVKVEGVTLLKLRLSKDQAADVARTFTTASSLIARGAGRAAWDDEVADFIIASVVHQCMDEGDSNGTA